MKINILGLTIATGAVAAVLCLDAPASRAGYYGDARWCAVTNQGADNLMWDCEYDTADDCTPAVTVGNLGYCAINPYWQPPQPSAAAPYPQESAAPQQLMPGTPRGN